MSGEKKARAIVLTGTEKYEGQVVHGWEGHQLVLYDAPLMFNSLEDVLIGSDYNPKIFAGRHAKWKRFEQTGAFRIVDGKNCEVFKFADEGEEFIPVKDE